MKNKRVKDLDNARVLALNNNFEQLCRRKHHIFFFRILILI